MSRSRNHYPTAPLGSLVEEGAAFYQKHLKAALESDYSGKFVAIDPTTGRYFLGRTATAALIAANKALPHC